MSFTVQKDVEEEKIKKNHHDFLSHLKKIPVILLTIS